MMRIAEVNEPFARAARCVSCGRGIDEVSLFRQNPKGVPAVWACYDHSKPLDPELVAVAAAIEVSQEGVCDG